MTDLAPETLRRHKAQAILRQAFEELHELDANAQMVLTVKFSDGQAAFLKTSPFGLIEPKTGRRS